MSRLSYIVRKLSWLPLVNLPVPFPLTLRHYYSVGPMVGLLKNGELASPEAWDALRLQHPHFIIPNERKEWLEGLFQEKDGQDLALRLRATHIVAEMRSRNITSLHSVGVGGAALEYFIKAANPSIFLAVSDYNPEGVARLLRVFTECDRIDQFDMTSGDWQSIQPADEVSAVLMYRVDPHFTDAEWRTIFSALACAGVRNVLYIPATEVSFQYLAITWLKMLIAKAKRHETVFTGYMRSASVFPTFWHGLYSHETMRLGSLNSYWLRLL